MSEKLGKELVDGGVVSADQVRAASENAVLHGGTLAESLFELGFIDDAALAKFISNNLDVGFVSDDLLGLIDPEMAEILPADIADEHHVMPIEFSNGALEIAVSDPFDRRISDEIEFFTGYPVKPMVATIRGLSRALKNYYGIKWNVRPPSVAKAEESVLVNWEQMKEEPTAIVPPPPKPPPAPRAPAFEQPAWEAPTVRTTPVMQTPPAADMLSDTAPIPAQGLESPAAATTSAPAPATASAPASVSPPTPAPAAPSRPARPRPRADAELLDEIMGMVHAEDGVPPRPSLARRRRTEERTLPFDEAIAAIESAPSRDEIAEFALIALFPLVDRLLLSTLKGELIVGWSGRGVALSPTKARTFLVPLSLPSVFQQVLTTQDVVEDKPGAGPIDIFMAAFLGGRPPARITAVPVIARGRTVAFVYGDVASATRPSAADAFQRVSSAMGAAFARLLDTAA